MADDKTMVGEEPIKPEEKTGEPQTAEVNETQDENQEGQPAEPKQDDGSKNIDYKAELERAQKTREELEKAKKKIRFMEQEKKREEGIDLDEVDERIDQKLDEKLASVQDNLIKSQLTPRAKERAYQVARSEDEAKLILDAWEHDIKQTGDVILDIEKAQAIANKSRLQAENSELKRALQSQGTAGKGTGPGQKPEAGKPEPGLSEADKAFIKTMNAKWDAKKKAYVLPGGEEWRPGS